jgi:hypothetical protein
MDYGHWTIEEAVPLRHLVPDSLQQELKSWSLKHGPEPFRSSA